ncbi:N-methylhydantoinase A/oxoprolinase/acetone carboxylase, beta subunit [Lentibacillus halodurans]|uniref:N-methylhydantoinase A/oxoprolinase/acetone carboxylase, beta subunit n=1 Tax=Lentibacillus halodurans TaxID=237679 RepID=A0A1I0VHL4_9BACI|nr:hydantoinase/oxoprolinase family protein [Lentibacillus halodurans]SFA75989.1 N-methylhydantoinase A/oxoprolinase/acetone carboxylase, beta subunit [Lentibacillus halodurans]
MKVRVGIDVGGTFTDAVAIDNDSYELVGKVKVPTTHSAHEGVALGIVQSLEKLLSESNINESDVVFLAHGTTQATNAFLEGDVSKVGIFALGTGLEGKKAKADSKIDDIELAKGRYLQSSHQFLDTSKFNEETANETIQNLLNDGSEVIVGSESYSVDNPTREKKIMDAAKQFDMPATATHEVSKLYGLKTRTKTAVLNASILPKMIQTVNMTEDSVKKAGIKSQLMIMRCDGGVMNVDEVRSRPILTMLSGPAAGVAGALMYEKVSNGIFLEVGGTSTDISVIKNGKVMIEYAQIGGHKTYINSLDVRTVGIAGGSMIKMDDQQVSEVGPRSAHIADLAYAVYTDPDQLKNAKVVYVEPKPGDSKSYVVLENEQGERFALTLACVANYLGYVDEGHYAYGNKASATLAVEALAKETGKDPKQLALEISDKAAEKNLTVIDKMIKDYDLDLDGLQMLGGGGGAAAVVPYLAEKKGVKSAINKNAEVISPIGVALAMVREVVERSMSNPSEDDILKIRKEAEEAVVRAGAELSTVEVQVEVDATQNIVRAIGTGATDLRTKDLGKTLTLDEIKEKVIETYQTKPDEVVEEDKTDNLHVIKTSKEEKKLWGLMKKRKDIVHVVDNEGVIKLKKNGASIKSMSVEKIKNSFMSILEDVVGYGDGGVQVPDVFILQGKRIIDCSGVIDLNQIMALVNVELQGIDPETKLVVIIGKRSA